jgi:outer membrane protein
MIRKRRFKAYLVILVFIINPFNLFAQNSDTLYFSLIEAIDYAMNENVNVMNSKLEITKAQKMVKEQMAVGLPQINDYLDYKNYLALPVSLIPAEFVGGTPGEFVEIQFGVPHNLSTGLNFSQMLFDTKFFFGLKASRIYVELIEKQYDLSKINMKDVINKAYYAVLISEETQKILDKNVEIIGDLHFKTSQLYENGFVEEIEVDRVKLNLSSIKTMADNNKRNVMLSTNLLKYYMGIDVNKSIILTDTLNLDNAREDELLNESIDPHARIDYQLLDVNEKLREMNARVIRSGYYPYANLIAGIDFNAQRNQFDFTAFDQPLYKTVFWGVSLNLPIWDSWQKGSAIQQEKITIATIRNQKKDLQNSIVNEILEKRIKYENALNQLETQVENKKLAEKIFTVATQKYNEGVGSSIEVDNAQSTLFNTQSAYIETLYQVLIAKTDLLKALQK